MPLFMDLHELPEGISAQHVAEMHQADLSIEHKFNCRGLTYWCDEKRKTAFCLIDAPNEQAVINLHKNAHGAIPMRIIQVNDAIVESFLGRIEDPEKSKDVSLNIINEPAFRSIMVVKLNRKNLIPTDTSLLKTTIKNCSRTIKRITAICNGRIVKHKADSFLISFKSVTDAITCGIKIQEFQRTINPNLELKIGISAGVPVTDKLAIFEDTIRTSDYLSDIAKGDFSITRALKDLYEGENQNRPIPNGNALQIVNSSEENFITHLMAYTEAVWAHSSINVHDFERHLGYSKSKFYRTIVDVVGQSPNLFLRDYRLKKALLLLEKQSANISEIAYQTGFSSPAYFSKCFYKKYGILPSNLCS
ncbi:nickel-binding protein [uncultured Gelidibacter sp.]|uniref:nickel-binding protein n=1 Tax=uncultured Gelidibacter sp. TaxID=259318 RepID=UPI0026157611|nr:nickel-binding protein [uncultured Gelidibacter sp.]